MSRKIIGVTVGTPLSIRAIKDKLNPVTQVNGATPDENGNVEIEAGGGVTSWNDLTDKPFYVVDNFEPIEIPYVKIDLSYALDLSQLFGADDGTFVFYPVDHIPVPAMELHGSKIWVDCGENEYSLNEDPEVKKFFETVNSDSVPNGMSLFNFSVYRETNLSDGTTESYSILSGFLLLVNSAVNEFAIPTGMYYCLYEEHTSFDKIIIYQKHIKNNMLDFATKDYVQFLISETITGAIGGSY
jgi:hypothetical protein